MYTKRLVLYIIVFIILVSSISIPQSKTDKIDELLNRYLEYRLFNGSTLVADNGEVIFKKGYGLANMEWNIPNSYDTKFRLGSITKQFTSMLIMQLVEKNKIKLEDKITDYLPYYRKDIGDKVTIEMLLTHTSGIPSYTNQPDFFEKTSKKYFAPDDFIKEYCSGDLEFEPGTKFNYNNSGYFILGGIIEHVTGKTYEEALSENIIKPLGLNETGYDNFETIINKRAAGYEKAGSGYSIAPYLDMALPYAAGSLYSTVEDLYKWDLALLNNKILPKKYMDDIFKGRVDARNSQYAYGWFIDTLSLAEQRFVVYNHGGGINGFNTINYIVPEKGHVVILFSNAGGAPLNNITNAIINILNDQEYKFPAKPLVDQLNQTIEKEGVAEAISQFNKLKNDKELYSYNERELNLLGYSYLRANKIEEAIEIFKLNIQEYPKSWNVYDSYAEALMVKGENEGAIENYKKSLELNPNNKQGIEQLKKLGVDYKVAEIVVENSTLIKYAGEYQLFPEFILTIRVDGNRIFAQATGQSELELFPLSETKFYDKVVNAQMEFFADDKGEISKLVLYQNNREMPGKKIK
jgi:CubicO group peptidase (beta-lactamase class C family)